MKKTMRYIGMAALALVGTIIMSCSENDLAENQPKGKAVTLTTTISLDGSSSTRALDADGKKTFAKGDQIALIYQDANDGVQKVVSAALQETDILSEGKKATLTFSLEKAPKAKGNLAMFYPASMAPEVPENCDEFGTAVTIDYDKLLGTQDGTFNSLATGIDFAYCDADFTSDGLLPNNIQLANELAILELSSITDYDGNDLTSKITELYIKVGSTTYHVSRTAAAGSIYVAVQPCSDSNITIYSTISKTEYGKIVPSKTLAAGTMTPVKLKMQKAVDLSALRDSPFEAQNGDMLTGTLGANVKISIAAGAAITLKDAEIKGSGTWAGITCIGNATIILEGTNKVQAFGDNYPGILAAYNGSDAEYTLTIKGEGSLEVIGGRNAAGIGGSGGYCGNIKIEGGNITATGGTSGAGIGSGDGGECGDIKISGGTITAIGSANAAGIGSGENGQCGVITISGGEIKQAKGGVYAAGIGSGKDGRCDIINIENGTITAEGGVQGAGIGTGYTLYLSKITISGGTITASGGELAAGIGSGYCGLCGNIDITGGTIKATGSDYAAGIGCGGGDDVNSLHAVCGNITISGGKIELAQGGDDAAGIGSGFDGVCGSITITTGVTSVTAKKGANATYSIGNGYNTSTCGTVTIGGTEGGISTSPYTYQPSN